MDKPRHPSSASDLSLPLWLDYALTGGTCGVSLELVVPESVVLQRPISLGRVRMPCCGGQSSVPALPAQHRHASVVPVRLGQEQDYGLRRWRRGQWVLRARVCEEFFFPVPGCDRRRPFLVPAYTAYRVSHPVRQWFLPLGIRIVSQHL